MVEENKEEKLLIERYFWIHAEEILKTVGLVATTGGDLDLEDSRGTIKCVFVDVDGVRTLVLFRRPAGQYRVKGCYFIRQIGTGLRVNPPIQQRQLVIRAFHDNIRYFVISATINFVEKAIWCPAMREDATTFINSYRALQLYAKEKNNPYNHHQPAYCTFETIAMVFAGALPKAKYKYRYILFSVRHLTYWDNTEAAAR